ncbi:Uncharacterised protein [Escherichia coli]|uniref:Transposase n=1 Tax=Escherichia coli TaxID=562 RepID=A0A376MP73_ECOLX|nr:Uncharacterised protein [Escherichia coli]
MNPEQVRVADITYLPLRNSSAYLSLVTDACSRKIMGYHVGENLQTENVVKRQTGAEAEKNDESPGASFWQGAAILFSALSVSS